MKKALVTGSSGLIGSEAVLFLEERGWEVHGVDNNMRRDFFGTDGDTGPNLRRLQARTRRFTHHPDDVRNRDALLARVAHVRPDLVVHCAAQPSHELASARPFDDFDVNAVGTHNLLEAVRRGSPAATFVFMSTNKVYGDAPNEYARVELPTRWDYADAARFHGVDESCRIDATLHSPFGASKLAADIMVQEYGRYYGMPTVCFRGGCLTGGHHAGAELHGFLAYLAKCVAQGRTYRVLGYKGKQVRDNIHAHDVCTAILAFHENPRPAAVYNLGGGRANSISMMEAIAGFERLVGRPLRTEYVDQPRVGDHICYITDMRRFRADHPAWSITRSLDDILREIAAVALSGASQ